MAALRLLFADQISHDIATLRDADPSRDLVLMVEVRRETDYVPHHPKKIAFLFAAMRHFAAELRERGLGVRYVGLDDPDNRESFTGELERALESFEAERIIVTWPGEYRVLEEIRTWREALGVPVEIREDDRFLCTLEAFAGWRKGRKQPRMEYFYRWMRERTGWLMDETGKPEGGSWNYDAENRKPADADLTFPSPAAFEPDAVTLEVLELVERRFGNRFGEVRPFSFAVSREQALMALEHFVAQALPRFGDYQDAMLDREDWLYHSALSQYLNCGLLGPREICKAALDAYDSGHAPLNCVEGFIRQILGWREYCRGIYWTEMPDYAGRNRLNAQRPLPQFYWDGHTEMRCMAHAIDQTRRTALSHHIQRLMLTGNFAMLIGVVPEQICTWYLAVYADAYEWVELPNVLGMAMFADGGLMGSKPYAAGGNYIDKMSNFCRHCRYDVKKKNGSQACPFNYLYWNFLIENRESLEGNRRLMPIYATLKRMGEERRSRIREDAATFIDALEPWTP